MVSKTDGTLTHTYTRRQNRAAIPFIMMTDRRLLLLVWLFLMATIGVELDEGGDPPRIWSPFGEYPGTAFTRSMGDVIAEELGVSADPEIIRRRIHPSDK